MNVQDMWGFAQADRVVCSARAYCKQLVHHRVPTRKLVYLPWGLPLEELPFREAQARDGADGLRRWGARGQQRGSVGAQGRKAVTDRGTARRARTRGTARVQGGGPIMGFVGRIEPRKGQVELVEVLARVRRHLPGARLELVGPVADEPYGRALNAAIHAHHVEGAVTLHDRVPSVLEFLQRWDLFVSLSSDEGQGLAVLEAMAVGVPVVARPVAGIEDFLTHKATGIAIARSGSVSAAGAIVRAVVDQALCRHVVTEARRLVERRYSWERALVRFDRIYASVS